MKIKDIWLIDKRVNDGKILFTLPDLVSLIQMKMNASKSWDELTDIKYLYNEKEGWMAVCHFG